MEKAYLQLGRDSYHYPEYHRQETGRSYQNGLLSASRGTQRYDPATRRYTEWSIPNDWHHHRVNDQTQAFYPRFTRDEARKLIRRLQHHRHINPRSMGPGWTTDGPRVRLVPGISCVEILLIQDRGSNKSTIGSGKIPTA